MYQIGHEENMFNPFGVIDVFMILIPVVLRTTGYGVLPLCGKFRMLLLR